ncbi:MAG: DUF6371 domain-containing protein [Bacteroidota bacterium]
MGEHKYILEPYKGMNTRYRCPSCQQWDKTFSLYIDLETGEHINPTVGRCNRESNCGYHYTPKQYYQDNNISYDTTKPKAYKPRPVTPQPKPISFIPDEVFKTSLKAYETNHFVKFLINLFGVEVCNQLVSRYFIATSKHWDGATVFWQIDTQGKVRTGKIMLYNPTTGKRIKKPFNHINWVHTLLKTQDFELRQCLFGEHLLIDKTKPVAIVESEKTAVIASVYFPEFIWLAFGGIGFNIDKCKILKGREVYLFPDLKGYEKWNSKAKELSHIANFKVFDLLEREASEIEREQGLDLADYLVRFDYREFIQEQITPAEATFEATYETNIIKQEPTALQVICDEPIDNGWEKEIAELEAHFSEIDTTRKPIMLNSFTKILDCSKFIDSHLAIVKRNINKTTFLPFLSRLKELKKILVS